MTTPPKDPNELDIAQATAALLNGREVEARKNCFRNSDTAWFRRELLNHWYPGEEHYRLKPKPRKPHIVRAYCDGECFRTIELTPEVLAVLKEKGIEA